jgi:predicted RNA-binding protein with PIN domain
MVGAALTCAQRWDMRWIVDGMNLIGSRPDGWWLDRAGARRRLVADLAAFGSRPGVSAVWVVFDGVEAPDEIEEGAAAKVNVSFAGRGVDAADRVIAQAVEASEDPAQITVVTSDAALASEVRSAGASVVGVSAFRRQLE